jgi:hypothetical protein
MNPDYTGFWRTFQASDSWQWMMMMALYSDTVELRVMRLELVMMDAMAGHANPALIQRAISRLLDMINGQITPEAAKELAPMLAMFGIEQAFDVPLPEVKE